MAKSLEQAKEGFKEAGITQTGEYQRGTQGKGQAWNNSKGRAKANFAPAMTEVLSKKSYDTGIDAANASSYDEGVLNKGVPNWGVGMQASSEKYGMKVSKYVPLWGEALPTSRGARRSANNLKRMTENVTRFVAKAGK